MLGLLRVSESLYSGVAMCQLSLPGFDGPADAFLSLVAQHRFPADEVPVADVTQQFLSQLTQSESVDLRLAGELMAASARLMVLKSAHLLIGPADDDEDAVEERAFDPMERTRFGPAIGSLAEREGQESFVPQAAPIAVERRPEPRSPHLLVRAWQEMDRRSSAPRQRLAVPGFVRLEVAVSRLIRALRSGSVLRFRQLLPGSNRNDTVVHFMAVLELMRQRRLHAEQAGLFSDITLQWVADSAESSSRVG